VEQPGGEYPSTLSDRYNLLGVIGSGGMGVVWRAYDQSLQRQVACKVLSGSIGHDPLFLKRFRREAHHIASLSHPNIVMVYDSGTDGDFAYIVMEYVKGASLRQLLVSEGVLPVQVTAALAVDVLAALGHAHERGIVHRDVKPANLLLESGGGVKVADFGISKSFGEMTELTSEGGFVGTSTYASPEQLSGRPLGAPSDLYSLGCVLYQCLTGQPPYAAAEKAEHQVLRQRFADPPALADFPSGTPSALAQGISRALAKEPSDRFSSAAEMRGVFLPYASHDALPKLVFRQQLSQDRDRTKQPGSEVTPVLPGGPRSDVFSPSAGKRVDSAIAARSKFGRKTAIATALAVVVLLATVLILVSNGGGKNESKSHTSNLPSGGFLRPGHSIESPNGRFKLGMQLDGNLVEYAMPKKIAQWQSGTSGNFDAYAIVQADGNFVVYPLGKTAPLPGQPTSALWESGTYGHPGSSAALLNDGDVVVRSPRKHAVLWRAPTSTTE
jgi:eukaryotic-like serine/threonine-protein kinase